MHIDIDPMTLSPIRSVFVGRKSELRALNAHFKGNGRLAQITGFRGTGKTSLALMFAHGAKTLFPGGVRHVHAFSPQHLEAVIIENARPSNTKRSLVILDDLDLADRAEITTIPRIMGEHPKLSVLLLGDVPVDIPDIAMLSLSLGGLNQDEFHEVIKRRLAKTSLDIDLVTELYNRAQGNPQIAEAASQSVRDGLVNWRQFLLALNNFDYRAILGPDGKPYGKSLAVPKKVVVAVTAVNTELLARLKARPELIRTLSPRKFEEVVAELLGMQGYEVQLTPASRDGGFDMYAAKNDALGQFLYLVECKRYSPPNKVGVQVIRELHGVVQQSRATAGIITTTSFFTDGAKEFQQDIKHQIQLRDYIELQKWLGVIK